MKKTLKRTLAFVSAMTMLAPFVDLPKNPLLVKDTAIVANAAEVTPPSVPTIGDTVIKNTKPSSLDNGLITVTNECIGEVEYGNKGNATLTAKTGTVLTWNAAALGSDESGEDDRFTEGYWYGVNISIPFNIQKRVNRQEITKIPYRVTTNANGGKTTEGDYLHEDKGATKGFMQLWCQANYDTFKSVDGDLKYTIEFNWDNEGDYDQKFDIVLPYDAVARTKVASNHTHILDGKHAAYQKTVNHEIKYCLGIDVDKDGKMICLMDGTTIYDIKTTSKSKLLLTKAEIVPQSIEYVGAQQYVNYQYKAILKPQEGYSLPSAANLAIKFTDNGAKTLVRDANDGFKYNDKTGELIIYKEAFDTKGDSGRIPDGTAILIDYDNVANNKNGVVNEDQATNGFGDYTNADWNEGRDVKYASDNKSVTVTVRPGTLDTCDKLAAHNVGVLSDGYVVPVRIIPPQAGDLKAANNNKYKINGNEYTYTATTAGTTGFELKTLITNEDILKAKAANNATIKKTYKIDWDPSDDSAVDFTVNIEIVVDTNESGYVRLANTNTANLHIASGAHNYREAGIKSLGLIIDNVSDPGKYALVCKACCGLNGTANCKAYVEGTSAVTGANLSAYINDLTVGTDVDYEYVIKLTPKSNSNILPDTVTVATTAGSKTAGTHYTYSKANGTITFTKAQIEALGASTDIKVTGACTSEATIHGVKLSTGGDIGFNVFTKLDPTVDASNYKLKVTFNGETKYYKFTDLTTETISSTKYYIMKMPVAAKEMANRITLQVVKGDNNSRVGDPVYTSVKNAAEITINSTDAELGYSGDSDKATKLRNLAAAILNYGATTQAHFDYNTDLYADDGLGDTNVTYRRYTGTGDDSLVNYLDNNVSISDGNSKPATELAGLSIAGARLELDTKTVFRYYFSLGSGANIDDYTFKFNGTKIVKPVKSGSLYYLEVSNILAKRLGSNMKLAVTKGTDSVTYNASCYGFCGDAIKDADQEDSMKLVAKALYAYGEAARAYFGNPDVAAS